MVYFGGLYRGKDNEKLWREVKEYIERQYETEYIEKIYFQSDGGGWMKKGIDILGAESVLDEFHIRKYIRKMIRLGGGATEEDRKKAEETLLALVNKNWTLKLYFFTYNLPLLYSRICFLVLPGCKISQRICRPFFVEKFYICSHFFLNIFSPQVKISK